MEDEHDMKIAFGQPENIRRTRRAFTLVELMLAIGVIIALTVVTLPAFRAIQEGNREAGGVNAVSAALNTARSMATRKGRDVAVMFAFDVQRQVCSLQLIEAQGITYDAGNGLGEATIFVPVKGQAPIELPQGAAVFGYGYGATRIGEPSNAENWFAELGKFYEDNSNNNRLKGKDPWLFPRSDVRLMSGTLRDADQNDMDHLETFIVRYNSDGVVVSSAEELAAGPQSGANDSYLELNHLHTDNDSSWDQKVREWTPQILNIGNGKFEVIPELQLRSVPYLAVVDLYKLGAEVGIRSPWLTLGEDHGTSPDEDVWDANGTQVPDHIEIDRWIEDNASILTFNRYTGNVMNEFRR